MVKTKGMVSIIVPNHGRDLTQLISSIDNSTYKNIELVIIDEGKERSAQRNIGLQRASGEFFLILDSDHSVHSGLIAECVELMQNGFSAIYIPEILVAPGMFGSIRKWERKFYTGTPVDVVRFVKPVNGYLPYFDETLNGPEDSAWDRQVLGRRVISFYPLYHNDNISFLTYLRKKAYYAESMRKYAEKWPGDKVLDWRWRCLLVFFENGKWKKVLQRPDLFICVMFIILLRGVIYYAKK